MAHKAQGTGNYKGKRDRHEKPDWTSDKKRKKSSFDNNSGRKSHPSSSSKRK